jgi:hypothetical protein
MSEKQQTANATQLTFEHNYLAIDVNEGNSSHEGWKFDYPIQWLRDQSAKKAVGLRRLEVKPMGFNFRFSIDIQQSTGFHTFSTEIEVEINATIPQILDSINTWLGKLTSADGIPAGWGAFALNYEYNRVTEELDYGIWQFSSTEGDTPHQFYFKMTVKAGVEAWCKLLNQTFDISSYLGGSSQRIYLKNVWNRNSDNYYWHATFSNSPHNYIALNGERWAKPNLIYPYNSCDNSFIIWCTRDGKTKAVPIYGTIIIQLCFIVNYKNSIVL